MIQNEDNGIEREKRRRLGDARGVRQKGGSKEDA